MTDKDQDKGAQTKISDLPDKAGPSKDDESIKGGRMKANPTESGDVTSGPSGGDQG